MLAVSHIDDSAIVACKFAEPVASVTMDVKTGQLRSETNSRNDHCKRCSSAAWARSRYIS